MAAGPGQGRVVARKRFGQHFLVDRAAVEAIVGAVNPQPADRLVEIGPGTGALTTPLLLRVDSLDAIEIDRDLAGALRRRWGERLRLHQQDVLDLDFGALAGDGGRIRLVGNLPYNISSPLLLHLTRFTAHVVDQHFMLQKEVVHRIAAQTGGDVGRLTVMLQAYYRVTTLFDVPPEAFDPPPKVESSVIRMLPRHAPLTQEIGRLQALLSVAFSQRRKMIRNTIGKWLKLQHPALDVAAAAEREPLLQPFAEPTRRAEEIPVASWCALADLLGR